MKISELTTKDFLNGTNAMAQSYVVVNYKDNTLENPITYTTSLEILGKSIANHLNLLRYNSGATQTYGVDAGLYTVGNVDITGKADKVASATANNFAGLDENGNLIDSGHKHADYDLAGAATAAVAALDITQITNTAGKTVATIDEADGKVSATFQDISILSSQISDKGSANCVATLDANGHVPSSQLPSYVDDVIEGTLSTFPATGETGKIYVDTATNISYRWSGSQYVKVASDLALGTTSSTAYRGDYGDAAYAHAVTNKGIEAYGGTAAEKVDGLMKFRTNAEGHIISTTAVAKADITALGIPGSDTTYVNATTATAGLMSAADKTKLDNISLSGSIDEMPMTPNTDGVYLLRATVSSGAATYDWVSAPDASGVSF